MTEPYGDTAKAWLMLTPSQQRVVAELARDGAANDQIGRRLYLAVATVKLHLGDAMAATGCPNRTALALWWERVGRYNQEVQ